MPAIRKARSLHKRNNRGFVKPPGPSHGNATALVNICLRGWRERPELIENDVNRPVSAHSDRFSTEEEEAGNKLRR